MCIPFEEGFGALGQFAFSLVFWVDDGLDEVIFRVQVAGDGLFEVFREGLEGVVVALEAVDET